MKTYSVFYLKDKKTYTWSLITHELQNAIDRYNILPFKSKPVIIIGRIENRDYTIKEIEKMEKYTENTNVE